jgi:hypothetical protein
VAVPRVEPMRKAAVARTGSRKGAGHREIIGRLSEIGRKGGSAGVFRNAHAGGEFCGTRPPAGDLP